MGNIAVVGILTDAWGTMKEHPDQFMKNIDRGMSGIDRDMINSYPVESYSNYMMVQRAMHDSIYQALLIGPNGMSNLNDFKDRNDKAFAIQCKANEIEQIKHLTARAESELKSYIAQAIVQQVQKENPEVCDKTTILKIATRAHLLDTVDERSDKKKLVEMAYDQMNK